MPHMDSSPEPPFDSVLVQSLDLVPISTDRFVTAGRFGGTWSPPAARAVAVVSDTTGSVIRSFMPRSTYPQDFSPFL